MVEEKDILEIGCCTVSTKYQPLHFSGTPCTTWKHSHLGTSADGVILDVTTFTFHSPVLYVFCFVIILCILFIIAMFLYLCCTVSKHAMQYNTRTSHLTG